MPILFMLLGSLLLYEIIVKGTSSRMFGSKVLFITQFILVMLSYFIKPFVLSNMLGIQLLAVIALCLGIKITKKNLIPTIVGTGFFIFVYLLSTLHNYELLSIMNSSFYCIILLIICSVVILHPYLFSNIARLSVLLSFVVDYFLIKDVGGFVVIGNTNLASFAIIICYVCFVVKDRVIKKKEVKSYEKIA